jgi:type VII secretion-associated protein (TIGR03931 family)
MISRLVHERTGVVPTSLDQPETVVARGALRAVLVDPDRTGALPGSSIARLGRGEDTRGERTEVVRPGAWPRDGRADAENRTELQPRPGGRQPSGPLPVAHPPSPGRGGYGGQAPGGVANPVPGGAGPALGKGPGGAAASGGGLGAGSTPGGGPGGAGSALGSGPSGGPGPGSGPGAGSAFSSGGPGPRSAQAPVGVSGSGGLAGGPSGPNAVRSGGGPLWAPSPGREDAETNDRKRRSKLLWIGVPVVVILLVAGLVVYLTSRPGDQSGTAPGRAYAQYDFSLVAPEDWVQTSDQVAQRQVILHPQESVAGNDLVVAQEYVMDYDATADRQRLINALRAEAGSQEKYSGFDPGMTYGGRTVIGYHETKGDQLQVDWYVVVQGKFRVHVGCQYNVPALRQRVAAACDQVVRTLKITS